MGEPGRICLKSKKILLYLKKKKVWIRALSKAAYTDLRNVLKITVFIVKLLCKYYNEVFNSVSRY